MSATTSSAAESPRKCYPSSRFTLSPIIPVAHSGITPVRRSGAPAAGASGSAQCERSELPTIAPTIAHQQALGGRLHHPSAGARLISSSWRRALSRVRHRVEVQRFYLGARPRRLAQKLERRLDARVLGEAPDIDACSESIPAVALHKVLDHCFEGDPVQWIDPPGFTHRKLRSHVPKGTIGATNLVAVHADVARAGTATRK
jgi:hypothetical protein